MEGRFSKFVFEEYKITFDFFNCIEIAGCTKTQQKRKSLY